MSQHARNTAIFSALTLLSRLSGMIRIMVFAFAIGGRTVLADSYQLAFLIPSTIYEFIAGGLLSAVFIPILVREQEKSGRDSAETWRVANLLLGGVGILLSVTAIIGLIAAPWIIDAMTFMGSEDGNSEAKRQLATDLFRYFTPQILLLGINAVFMAILNSLGVFAVTAAAPIVNNLLVIGCFFAYHWGWIDVAGLAIGTTLGSAAMIFVQLPWLLKAGMKIRPLLNLKDPVFQSVTQLGWPILLVSIANFFGWAVRSNLLSTVLGAFAIYTLCFQIIMMPYGIVAVSIATVLYPSLSRHVANKRKAEFISDMALGFRWTTFILLPVSLGIAVLSMPIVRVLFEHRGGQFTFSDSLFTSHFLGFYALSIAPYSLVMFATRVFYSMKDTRTPAVINIAGVIINAIISFFLLKIMGAAGIAVSAVIVYTLTTTASLFMIRFETGGLGGKAFWIPMGKMAIAAIVMAVVVHSIEVSTRPELITMERGQRLTMSVPQNASRGGLTMIHSSDEFSRIWEALNRPVDATPQVDFSRNTVALVWGPLSKTTSTLEIDLDQSRLTTSGLELRATVQATTARATSSTLTLNELVTSPAYALVQIHRPDADASLSLNVASPDDTEFGKSSMDFDIIRLLALIGLGAFVYAATAYLMRLQELESSISAILSRLKRFRK